MQIKIGDGYPQLICTQCISIADQAYSFRILCQESEAKLKAEMNSNDNLKPKTEKLVLNTKNVDLFDNINKNVTIEIINLQNTDREEVVVENITEQEQNVELLVENDNTTVENMSTEETVDMVVETLNEYEEDIANEIETLDETVDMIVKDETEPKEEVEYVIEIPDDEDCDTVELPPKYKKYICQICHLDFPSANALSRHKYTHRNGPTFYECQLCPKQ